MVTGGGALTKVRAFGDAYNIRQGEVRINRVFPGDDQVGFSVTSVMGRKLTEYPGLFGLTPADARAFAQAIIEAADVVDPPISAATRSMHERHVNLLAGCPLCALEAGGQRDRLMKEED